MELIKKLISITGDKNAVVLDMYSRAGAVAHSVMELNIEDGGKRSYILVQGTENEEGDREQASLIKNRIDLAGEKLAVIAGAGKKFDNGFIVYKVDANI